MVNEIYSFFMLQLFYYIKTSIFTPYYVYHSIWILMKICVKKKKQLYSVFVDFT